MNEFSIPHICQASLIQGEAATEHPNLLIEIPHGATKAEHYHYTRRKLQGELPENLSHFFFVNTDVGSPECALAIAQHITKQIPSFCVLLFQSLIPRTFIDCNRVIGLSTKDFSEGGVTPGIPPYIQDPKDKEYLITLHQSYQKQAQKAYAWVCSQEGLAMMLHSYAPKSVGIQSIDANIVFNLHRVYQPDEYLKWPLRPQFDLITRNLKGERLSDDHWVERTLFHLHNQGFEATEGQSYPMHPSTTGYHHALRYPKQSLCLEIRRDLLMKEWKPFSPMEACPQRIERIAPLIAQGIIDHYSRTA